MGPYRSHTANTHLDLTSEEYGRKRPSAHLYKSIPRTQQDPIQTPKKDMGDGNEEPEDMGLREASAHIPRPYYKLLKNILK